MTIEETLNENQKQRIKKRLSLNFNQELKKITEEKKSFSKTFRNELDILIHQFYRDGIQFYGFTIDMLYLQYLDSDMWKNVHTHVEAWVNDIGSSIELIEFCYLSIELHQEKRLSKRLKNVEKSNETQLAKIHHCSLANLPHLHGIIGVRTILGENDFLDLQIKKVFRSLYKYEDIKIDRLQNIKNIKSYWNYICKENNFKFHRFVQYGKHPKYVDIYGSIADLELIYDQDRYAFDFDLYLDSSTKDISGVKIRQPSAKTLITYLLNLFMWHKNYKVNKNKIYQHIEDSKYSWRMVDTLDALKKNNVIVFECLKKVYPQQLSEINTIEIINKEWNATMDDIMSNNQYLPQLEFKSDAVEFKDGIYFINENKFFNFNKKRFQLDIRMKNKNCCVFFQKSYHHIKKPETWLSSIKKTVVSADDFCIDLARYFHSEPLEKLKQKSLVIVGGSNTGKTTLVTNVINNLFGKENIGMIGKGDNFILEQLEGKNVIIADEFKYSSSNRGSLLKLMGNELDLINKKGIQKYGFTNKAPILFMFNPNLNNLMLNDDAFKNRFKHYEFKHEITEYISNIDEILKKELSSIIIYCNKLYFKKKKLIHGRKKKQQNNKDLKLDKQQDEFPF